tara:strand:+ start:626 stop:1018 length:393 start_codon:yes stop_codon:yes gene_type:complete
MSQPNLWGFDEQQIGGKVSDAHPLTSHAAASKVRTGTQKAQAIIALGESHPNGLTALEISDAVVNGAQRNISPNQAATRLGELRDQGIAVYLFNLTGQPIERETTPGNAGIVHVLTDYGNKVCTNLRVTK